MTVASMMRLLQKNVKFEWNEKCQACFEKLKTLLTELSVHEFFHASPNTNCLNITTSILKTINHQKP